MATLGLIAGNGIFPVLLARSFMKDPSNRIVAVGFKGDTAPDLEQHVTHFKWVGVGQLGRIISVFSDHQVSQAVMAGQITPTRMFEKVKFDLKGLALFAKLKDKKADTIFGAVADELEKSGIQVLDSTRYLTDQLARSGAMTRKKPGRAQEEDIEFGKEIARELGRLDVGQTIVVKSKSVVAVEALEGTNATIVRGGEVGKDGTIVVKSAKPGQDMRFDVPVVGTKTIDAMLQAKAACLAVETGKTLLLDYDAVIEYADSKGVIVFGF